MDHKIVFSGRVRDGMSVAQVRGNLAEIFRITDSAVLDRMFSGSPVVLKKSVTPDQAKPFLMTLFKAGALCDLKASVDAAVPSPAQSSTPPALSTGAFQLAAARQDAVAAEQPGGPGLALSMMPDPVPAAAAPAQAPAPEHPGMLLRAAPTTAKRTPAAQIDEEEPGNAEAPVPERWAPGAELPAAAEGLSWGGFFAPLVWGSFNGMAFSAVPLLGVRVLRNVVPVWVWALLYFAFGAFYLVKGRELAWSRKSWRDVDHFLKVQRYWNYAGAALCVLFCWGMLQMFQEERRAERQAAAYEAMMLAEQEPDEELRAIAVKVARAKFLQSITDADERAEMQREFDELDALEAEMAESRAAARHELGLPLE